ncbi:MAG: ABC-ATPase domain-containing protein [Deltaproteobacteria bacterium]|nr:ABC-ATPase domain-containing protein [Deltaproteobacteria bacterium]
MPDTRNEQDASELARRLQRIDGRGYKAYQDIRGSFVLPRCTLYIDHVQGDPFAAPSKLRVRVPMSEAALPAELFAGRVRRVALCDFLARAVRRAITRHGTGHSREHGDRHDRGARGRRERGRGSDAGPGDGSGKSGLIRIDAGGQEVLERSAVVIAPDWVEARVEVGLPAAGRRVLGRKAEQLLLERLPEIVLAGLRLESSDRDEALRFVECVENQEHVRTHLAKLGLVAFVGNGAVLPRESGASDRPLCDASVVPFRSPPELEVAIEVPNPVAGGGAGDATLTGMGVPAGVTLIVGGGYHGKSTLLRALERGVYPHIPEDGRESVVSASTLVKIRAEDGRRVERVDIHPFISELPGGRSTRDFCSDDASGSTSQAANIVEAVEAGASGLLLDEDTSATNFMVRDARMQALVAKEFEPITPFLERVQELHRELGVSTVLVMGGCGDYFEVADRVIMLREYQPFDCTDEAREVARRQGGERRSEAREPISAPIARHPRAASFDASRGRRELKIDARGREEIVYGSDPIDLRGVEQLVDPSQTRAVGLAIHLASQRLMDDEHSLGDLLDALEALFDSRGLDVLDPYGSGDGRNPGNFARPRRFEIAAAINRLRTLRVDQGRD